jgi:tetratricopeptide (TPR) repeat protein
LVAIGEKTALVYSVRVSRRRLLPVALFLVLGVSATAGAQVSAAGSAPLSAASAVHDPLVDAAFEHFYNMEFEQSTRDFEKVLARHPRDPRALNHLLTSVLMHQLYETGAMNTGEYANDSFIGQTHRSVDPKVKERIKRLVAEAESIEEEELKANADDVDAIYARGVTRAQFSLYTALIERAWFSALRNAVGARHDHERVLELDPNYVDAKLVVGTHNFVMGSLPWSVKVAVALVGLSGSKEKGLQYLREVGQSDGENAVDAKIVLSLFLRREHNFDEARGMMTELATRYPKNYLFSIEVANLLRASGRLDEAAEGYRKVWQNGREGKYGAMRYELAAWGLGELLRSRKDYAGAAAAYELPNEVSNADPETLQKANLAAGKMYDLLQKRELAVKKYQTVVAENGGSPLAEEARRFMREAYRE